MKRKIMKLTLISLVGGLDIFFIAAQILMTTMNFKWSPWYDPENLLGLMILLFYPVTWGIVITLLCVNFIVKEMRENIKLLLDSIIIYPILLLGFDSTLGRFQFSPYFFLIFNIVLIGIIVIFVVLIVKILVNTVKVFFELIRENQYVV